MKERPILFSTEMVRAILEGRKTQTRRIVKKQPHGAGEWVRQLASWLFPNVNPYIKLKCPYGQPGDRLWVRETWFNDMSFGSPEYYYRANGEFDEQFERHRLGQVGPFKWRPSIFMPREACRLMLEVTDVRVERLQDISEEDAIAEGISLPNYAEQAIKDIFFPEPSAIYSELWESINGKGSWDKNPWIWVIGFKILDKV